MRVGKLFIVLLIFGCLPAMAADTTTWNFNVWGGKRAFTTGIETIKKILEAEGNGSFKLRINYGDALGPPKKSPESVRVNAFEAAQFCVGYYPNKFPLLSVLELPFLLPTNYVNEQTLKWRY